MEDQLAPSHPVFAALLVAMALVQGAAVQGATAAEVISITRPAAFEDRYGADRAAHLAIACPDGQLTIAFSLDGLSFLQGDRSAVFHWRVPDGSWSEEVSQPPPEPGTLHLEGARARTLLDAIGASRALELRVAPARSGIREVAFSPEALAPLLSARHSVC